MIEWPTPVPDYSDPFTKEKIMKAYGFPRALEFEAYKIDCCRGHGDDKKVSYKKKHNRRPFKKRARQEGKFTCAA